jgi:subtilisin-like proprotein convertase family protein/alpha-tubulin suppressor-like RCC1 family protein
MLLGIAVPQLVNEADNNYNVLIKQMNPWAYWRMDEPAPANDDKLVDSSGNGRAGRYSLDSPVDFDALIRNETNDALFTEYDLYPAGSIPDNSPAGYSDTVTVTETFIVENIRVDVDITHTYIGDLDIYLSNGVDEVLFRPKAGGSDDDLHASYASDGSLGADYEVPILADLAGMSANANWTIRVADGYGGDTGTLDHWKLSLHGSAGIDPCLSKIFNSSYIPIENAATDKLGSELLPIREFEAWVVFVEANVEQIFFREGSHLFGWAVGISDGEICVGVAVNGVVKKASYNASNLTAGKPYHVCGIVDLTNDRLKLYISAQLVDEVENAGLDTHASATGAVIGSGYDHNSLTEYNPLTGNIGVCDFFGALDEIAIYDRERTEQERELAYLTGDLGITPPLPYDGPRQYLSVAPSLERRVISGDDQIFATDVEGDAYSWGLDDFGHRASLVSNGVMPSKAGGMAGGVSAMPFSDSINRHAILLGDGTAVTWGTDKNSDFHNIQDSAGGFVDIAQGSWHVIGLKPDGTVEGYGDVFNTDGAADIPPGLSDVWQIFARQNVSAAIKNDGSVVVWGLNDTGIQTVPAFAVNVTSLAVNNHTVIALKAGGDVVAWGDNSDGVATPPVGLVATKVFITPGFKAGSDRWSTAMAITDSGGVVAWGSNDSELLNVPTFSAEVVDIALGGNFAIAMLADGSIRVWGRASDSRLNVPAEVGTVVSADCNMQVCAVVNDDGSVVVWGQNAGSSQPPDDLTNVTDIRVSTFISNRFLARRSDGTLVWWSSDDENYEDMAFPPWLGVKNPVQGWVDANANYESSLFLQEDGTLFPNGFLNTSYSSKKNQSDVATIQRVNSVGVDLISHSPNSDHHFVLTKAEELVYFGDAPEDFYPTPPFDNAVQLAAGYEHYVILQSNGTVVCWGDNSDNQCDVPPEIQGSIISVSCGEYHTVALLSDGTMRGWGNDDSNQSTGGDSLTDLAMVAATAYGTVTLTEYGDVEAWGDEVDTAAGDWPDATNGNVVAIYESNYYPAALICDGTITTWGGLSTQEPEPPGLVITNTDYCPLFNGVGLFDARVLYHFPIHPDQFNHGTLGSSPLYDLKNTPALNIIPAPSANSQPGDTILDGYAESNSLSSSEDYLGNGLEYSITVNFRNAKDGGYNGRIFELFTPHQFGESVILISNIADESTMENRLRIEHMTTGQNTPDFVETTDYQDFQSDFYSYLNWSFWHAVTLVRKGNTLKVYLGPYASGIEVFEIELTNPEEVVFAYETPTINQIRLAGDGMQIGYAGIFDFALREQDAIDLTINPEQWNQEPE